MIDGSSGCRRRRRLLVSSQDMIWSIVKVRRLRANFMDAAVASSLDALVNGCPSK